jgi:hypothetical protein
MRSRSAVLVLCLCVSSLFMISGAQASITPYSVFQEWLPVVVAAIFVGAAIAVLYYMAGVVVNDRKVKSRATGEIVQAVGTAILTLVIISFLVFFGSFISSNVVTSSLANSINSICYNSLAHSQLTMLNSEPTLGAGSICAMISNAKNNPTDPTTNLDYGIESSYVILANLTDQTANNLNGLYMYENEIGFLSSLRSVTTICSSEKLWCAIPIVARDVQYSLSYTPFAGYSFINQITGPLETQAVFVFYMFLLQLLIIFLLLFLWPYMLAAGIILRSLSITRGTGGLLMAIALGSIIILPLVMLIEYSALGNGTGTATTPLIGANVALMASTNTLFSVNGLPLDKLLYAGNPSVLQNANVIQYNAIQPNFFVFPNVTDIAHYHDCFPSGGLVELEASDSVQIMLEGIIGFLSYAGGFVTGSPTYFTTIPCDANSAMSTAIDLTNVYGLISVSAFVIPLLNLIAVITAVRNLSYLFGGETEIAGIGRFL